MALGSTKPLTEMSTRSISWGWRRQVRKADNLTTLLLPLSRNLETLTSWNPLGLSRPVMGLLYLYLLHRKRQKNYTVFSIAGRNSEEHSTWQCQWLKRGNARGIIVYFHWRTFDAIGYIYCRHWWSNSPKRGETIYFRHTPLPSIGP